jgi:hypothetical protein
MPAITLNKACAIFSRAVKRHQRIRLTIRQRSGVLEQWPQRGNSNSF